MNDALKQIGDTPSGMWRLMQRLRDDDEFDARASMPSLTAAERQRVVVDWNATDTPFPAELCIHQLFETEARLHPESMALVVGTEELSYANLNVRANRLAYQLRGLGVGPEVLVGVCLERSADLVVALLGILKAGGAYVPLDPTYPPERLSFILEDARLTVLVTQESLRGLPSAGAQVVCMDSDRRALAGSSVDNPTSSATSRNLAYVLYTSGSTGRPKGVAVEHRSVVSLVEWARTLFGPEDLAGMLAATSINFDLSVFELFTPLGSGGRVILADNALSLPDLPAAGQVTLVNTVPSAMAKLLRLGGLPPSVRTVALAGEPLPQPLAQRIYQQETVRRVFNLYGPTETTVYSTWALVPKGADGPMTIGRPLANTQVYVLDAQFQPMPVGMAGDLYIGGVGLARGYLNRTELTAERFTSDPFSHDPEARLYRTGDRARWLASGELEYLGRLDHQVKIRGYRIELGEIETALLGHPGVREAVVAARDEGGDRRLVGYVVPADDCLSADELRAYLRSKLPEPMVPSAFVTIDALPLTPNGKVDRNALPAVNGRLPATATAYLGPRDAQERSLVGIWEKVLGVEPVGVRANFFELGGDSLLAVNILTRIEKAFDVHLPATYLHRHPTVEQLAQALQDGGREASPCSLVPIHGAEGKPPLVWVPGAMAGESALLGHAPYIPKLARRLGERRVYSLCYEYPAHRDGELTIEMIAASFLREIRTAHPAGPYALAGWSFGGLIAFEMARQLQAQGEEVELLALFDTTGPGHPQKRTCCDRMQALWARWLHLPPLQRLTFPMREVWGLVSTGILEVRRTVGRLLGRKNPWARVMELENAYLARLPRYDGRIHLFASRETLATTRDSTTYHHDPELGWRAGTEHGVEVHEVHGDHYTMFDEPGLTHIVDILRRCLR